MNLSNIKALILDMDGVLWRDTAPINDLPSIFGLVHEQGLKVAFATNNAMKTVEQYVEKFSGFGVAVEPWQIITSASATAEALSARFPERGAVFLVGEYGVERALEEYGFAPITDPEDESTPIAVVGGIDTSVTYAKLRRATLLVRSGLPFYGTNPDKSFPTPLGLVPGAGAILAAIETATDVHPIILGKPMPAMMHVALERLGTQPEETLVVGDRLETDIAAGQAAGCKTALVLSGVATREQAMLWEPAPDLIVDDLAAVIRLKVAVS
jgi:4-nitrophenyl phosphatase